MIHTSKSLKDQDGDLENYHYQLEDGEQYKLTEGEQDWLSFVQGRYSIYNHIDSNLDNDGVYTMDVLGMSQALDEDGIPYKAVCLDDETALQAIFFYSNYND